MLCKAEACYQQSHEMLRLLKIVAVATDVATIREDEVEVGILDFHVKPSSSCSHVHYAAPIMALN